MTPHAPDGHHLAELNLGILKHDWDDPRIKGFVDGLDLVNSVAQRSPGFEWMLPPDAMDTVQNDPDGPMGGNPRMASTLSVWQSLEHLEHFVWNTIHKRFYDRRAEWYDLTDQLRFVMWWVPVGHHPDMSEAMDRYLYMDKHGASDHAFGWAHLKNSKMAT